MCDQNALLGDPGQIAEAVAQGVPVSAEMEREAKRLSIPREQSPLVIVSGRHDDQQRPLFLQGLEIVREQEDAHPCQKAGMSDSTSSTAMVMLKARRRFGFSSQRLSPVPNRIQTTQAGTPIAMKVTVRSTTEAR